LNLHGSGEDDHMGRRNLLSSTKKKSKNPEKTDNSREAEKKKNILDGVKAFPGSLKANLEKLGLAQSTYYGWLKRYKADGVEGLKAGAPVSDKTWSQFNKLNKKQEKPVEGEVKTKVEEKLTMTSHKDKDKTKELLFKKFDGETAKKGETAEADDVSETASSCASPPEEPIDKTMKYAIGAFVCVVGILLIASLSNSGKFYFHENNQMVELWQGRFAPMGEKLVTSFSDTKILAELPSQESYTKKQAYGVLFGYLVKQADDILNTGRTPDLKTVRSYLTQATKYATTRSQRQAIHLRMNSINFLVLSGKADLALAKGTVADFEAAKKYLTEAMPFASTDVQKETVTKRMAAIEYAMATNKISKGEKQLALLYRDALNRHLKKAKQYSPEKSEEIDQEIKKIRTWLDEFDKRHVGR
jgi:hypothetical protein